MNRLQCIKSMVTKCNTAADIGTDHGYIAEMLLNDNTAENIIATDLNKGPLNRAVEYLTSINLSHKCDFRLGSGLEVLSQNEADAIIIAGMGGDLISDIIENRKIIALGAKQLILQPMTHVDNLRKYLLENGFLIEDENIVKEFHHYYFIIKATPNISNNKIQKENETYYEFSKILLHKKDEIFFEYLRKIMETNNKIILNLRNTNNQEYERKIEEIINKNKIIEEMLNFEFNSNN